MRKSLWSAFMTLTLVAIAIVGCMMMFSGGKEIASSGRDATLIREIDNATIMDVHDYDYLRGLDDYESYAEEVQSAIDYDDTHSERIESAALGAAPKVQHASGVEIEIRESRPAQGDPAQGGESGSPRRGGPRRGGNPRRGGSARTGERERERAAAGEGEGAGGPGADSGSGGFSGSSSRASRLEREGGGEGDGQSVREGGRVGAIHGAASSVRACERVERRSRDETRRRATRRSRSGTCSRDSRPRETVGTRLEPVRFRG